MCLAIAPEPQSRNRPIDRLWKRLSATPLRLLSLGAGVHAVAWGLLLAGDYVPATPSARGIFAFSLVYGVLGALLLGYLMTNLPKWLGRNAIHYGWYGGAYLALLLGLALMEAGLFLGTGWAVVGATLVLFAWFLGFRVLAGERVWASGPMQRLTAVFTNILAIGLAAIAAFAVGLAANWPPLMQVAVHGGAWLVLMPSLVGLALTARLKGIRFGFNGR